MKERVSRRGRPKKRAEDRREEYLRIRLTLSELEVLLTHSYKAGKTLSGWCRSKLLG
jgi:hypothetical protein